MIFVFGSNLAGRHGKGAALFAKTHRGAVNGQGRGRQGDSYAIPTKDENLNVLPLDEIYEYISSFCAYANTHKDLTFELTPIGTGLAGLPRSTISRMFKNASIPSNVFLSSTWISG